MTEVFGQRITFAVPVADKAQVAKSPPAGPAKALICAGDFCDAGNFDGVENTLGILRSTVRDMSGLDEEPTFAPLGIVMRVLHP